MEQGSLGVTLTPPPPPALPIEVELTGPEESQGEEKPERNPPSLHMDELPGVLVMLISLVWREKGVELGVWPSHCVWRPVALLTASDSDKEVLWGPTDVTSVDSARASFGQPLCCCCWFCFSELMPTCKRSQSSLMLASEANWALTVTPEMDGFLSSPVFAWTASSMLEKQINASSDW